MKQSMTREENQGLRWGNKFHSMGKMSNFMNDMVYQPLTVPGPDLLDSPLSPLHRSELLEVMEQRGIPDPPGRRLTWRDYYAILRRPATDPYEKSPYKAAWEAKYPDMAAALKADWEAFLAALPPPDMLGTFVVVPVLEGQRHALPLLQRLAAPGAITKEEWERIHHQVYGSSEIQPLLLGRMAWSQAGAAGLLNEKDGKTYMNGAGWVVMDRSGEG